MGIRGGWGERRDEQDVMWGGGAWKQRRGLSGVIGRWGLLSG